MTRWCDWADAVLARPGPDVLVHGDLHGDNQVWDHDELRLVVDFATVGAAEPEYELRTYPGPGLGPGLVPLAGALCPAAPLAWTPYTTAPFTAASMVGVSRETPDSTCRSRSCGRRTPGPADQTPGPAGAAMLPHASRGQPTPSRGGASSRPGRRGQPRPAMAAIIRGSPHLAISPAAGTASRTGGAPLPPS